MKYIPKPGTYCNYVYLDPSRSNEPIYVGKGTRGRAYYHMRRKDMHPFVQRLQLMLKMGINPIIEFPFKDISSEEAVINEKHLIRVIGRKDLLKGPLLNLTDGGEGNVGAICSEEHKRKLSIAHTGKKASEETRAKMRDARFNMSAENKKKITDGSSRRHKGVPKTKEQIAKTITTRRRHANV